MDNKIIIQYLEESLNVAEKQFDMVEDFIDIAENVKTRMEREVYYSFVETVVRSRSHNILLLNSLAGLKKIENHLSQLL